jgi:hypothetical protein
LTDAPTVKVRVDRPPDVTAAGLNEPDTPEGAPLTDRFTVCAEPLVTAVVTVVAAFAVPWAAVTDAGDAAIEKSFVARPTTACDVRHPLASFE